jgi:DNA-binding HxlR family transcriptional regulator
MTTLAEDAGMGPGTEGRLALQLLAQDSELDQRILFRLLGRPRRWSEFIAIRGGGHDEVFRHSLVRLERQRYITKITFKDQGKKVTNYEITNLGIRVFLRACVVSESHFAADRIESLVRERMAPQGSHQEPRDAGARRDLLSALKAAK